MAREFLDQGVGLLMPLQDWSAEGYAQHASFVHELAAPLVDLLAPKQGERILDIGCGEGSLTRKIADAGALVTGVDGSHDMAAAARARGLDVLVMDAHALTFAAEFDAVVSNAALHWMLDPDAVLAGIARALRPSGRFVAEFGGHGNVAAIMGTWFALMKHYGAVASSPWYFPSPAEYRAKLEQQGFVVDYIELIPRPTPLPTGLDGWLETFGSLLLKQFPPQHREQARSDLIGCLRPVLCDAGGQWTADYVRLRVAARAHKSK